MKVLLVNGSPNEKGCTYTALCEIAKVLEGYGIQSEIFHIGSAPIGGCRGCRACAKLGKCVVDDIVNVFNKKAKDFDGYVFGSPVHYAAISGNMTCFMDRVFYSSNKDVYRLKPAAVIVSARRAGTTAAIDQLTKYLTISQMPVISSRYWNMVHGSKPEDVLKDEEGIATMKTLAHNMVYVLTCIDAGKKSGIQLPEKEPAVRTNFIK